MSDSEATRGQASESGRHEANLAREALEVCKEWRKGAADTQKINAVETLARTIESLLDEREELREMLRELLDALEAHGFVNVHIYETEQKVRRILDYRTGGKA